MYKDGKREQIKFTIKFAVIHLLKDTPINGHNCSLRLSLKHQRNITRNLVLTEKNNHFRPFLNLSIFIFLIKKVI